MKAPRFGAEIDCATSADTQASPDDGHGGASHSSKIHLSQTADFTNWYKFSQ